jgi:hypothetical protein
VNIVRYAVAHRERWNRFVADAKNATFLFDRGYMDYHADRFEDCSLIVFQNDQIIALFPASVHDDKIVSHGGLSYGGVLSGKKMSAVTMLEIFNALAEHYRKSGFSELRYKTIPHIYHRYPAEDDLYALFRAGAKLYRVDVTTAIELTNRRPFSKGKKYNLSKARKAGIEISESDDYPKFMHLLTETLDERHGVAPVHSADEITGLANSFPDNIRLFVAHLAGKMVAGTLVYMTDTVIHTQYMATTLAGRETGALDAVVNHLLSQDYGPTVRYLNFGISNEDEGRYLNAGLCTQKEMFGGSSVVHQFFNLSL